MEAIEQQIRATQHLTSDKVDVATLGQDYNAGSNFDKGVQYLQKHYTAARKVRGDGNCYYRAFLYSLCEQLNSTTQDTTKKERERIVTYLKTTSMDQVLARGYERFAIEMFWEEMVELLEALPLDTAALHERLNEENATSDYCTWYMRVLTAARLKEDPDRFVHFLEGNYFDIPTFCQREVEPMGRECGMVQVLALAEAMKVRVEIEYLDGHTFTDRLTKHTFGGDDVNDNDKEKEEGITLTLLYRPGHYDILYK